MTTEVTVDGEIVSVDVQAESALRDIVDRIQKDRPGWKVRFKQGGGAAAGSKKINFTLFIDPWPVAEKKAPEESGS
jgi:hypothetical protein